jgi:hypothetical protein
MSYAKLFGMELYDFFFRNFAQQDVLVFDSHVHDFFYGKGLERLPHQWRIIFRRNRNRSFEFFARVIRMTVSKGYSFVRMSDIFREYSRRGGGRYFVL